MAEKKLSYPVIAAVRADEELENALNSKVKIIFDLNPDLMTVEEKVKKAHGARKRFFIHIDLANGIGKDKSGILFAKKAGVDGIISTRVNIVKLAKEAGMFTVQRFFIVDSHSITTTAEAVKAAKPDMIEIMPGIVTKVVRALKDQMDVPIISGGLIETEQELEQMLESGAAAVSTGKKELWDR
ncbi:MAG: glycerol-3-phosphate responsive antiterminator [Ruminococcaceae bacterium]|nr:glycerol-3-phosphate responsive antiterminator [Oscillospiraceae bacterium]